MIPKTLIILLLSSVKNLMTLLAQCCLYFIFCLFFIFIFLVFINFYSFYFSQLNRYLFPSTPSHCKLSILLPSFLYFLCFKGSFVIFSS
ncbi:unnamed protein product [Meloidogyne enterolobii]|uniref:Uncharacterized protein n=1 Tax=Meloidogyne enterolobii TaxID=390850 RepID=A0ACB0XTW8_MELEN